jgi:hypothetical protein
MRARLFCPVCLTKKGWQRNENDGCENGYEYGDNDWRKKENESERKHGVPGGMTSAMMGAWHVRA